MKESNNRQSQRGNTSESSEKRSEAMRGHVNNPEGHNQYTDNSKNR